MTEMKTAAGNKAVDSRKPWAGSMAAPSGEITIFLVDSPERVHDCVRQAAVKFSSRVQFIPVRNVLDALQLQATERQLLLLGDRDEKEIVRAAQALDENELPRWGVVVLGRTPSPWAEGLPLEECTPTTMERLMRGVLQKLELLRENLRQQGDLQSLAHRFRHDLISPLHCIHLNCELIQELLDEDPAAIKKQLVAIQKSTAEIGLLIERYNEVLQASTNPPSTGKVPMQLSVHNALEEAETMMTQRGAQAIRPEKWPTVTGVPGWIETMWLNLLAHALNQGALAKPLELGWSASGSTARFWVGGLYQRPDDALAHSFMPFERLHSRPGHSLPLSVVHRLASLQNGQCGYERRIDGYSIFYFVLPLAEPITI